jgi:regulator of cell morphogenesis and NO signaling
VKLSSSRRVCELATDYPAIIPALEDLGIDYCCKGNRTLLEACDSVGVDADEWLEQLGEIEQIGTGESVIPLRDWNKETLSTLINFIVGEHQKLEHREMVHLAARLERARRSHGAQYPVIARVAHLFRRASETLRIHVHQEERELFQRIEEMEQALTTGREEPLRYERSLSERVLIEFLEHDVIDERLRTMRELTADYRLPSAGPHSMLALWADLRRFDRHLQRHIHLENNILYPRAIAMESGAKLAQGVFG